MSNVKYNKMPELIPDEIIERVSKLSPAQLCDGMKDLGIFREGCMDADILPIDESKIMVGTAYTVDTQEGDNFPIHVAIYQGKPGYVLVVAGKGYQEKAYMGDLMGAASDAIGLKGVVVDGYVRDKLGLKEMDIPIYARGFMQRGPGKKGPGEINTTVVCGGIKVEPGDLVFGDCDGVTVVPRDRIEEVLERAEQKDFYEGNRRRQIKEYRRCLEQGEALPDLAPDWVNKMLADLEL